MTAQTDPGPTHRTPLSRDRVLRAAVKLADESGIESLSMRRIGHELGVEAMSLYNHVANKEAILDGIVDVVVNEIDPPARGADWKTTMRLRVLSARQALLRHPWASRVIVSRTNFTPTMLKYMESTLGILSDGGFSVDLAHHAMHSIGSRILGFTQELFEMDDLDPEVEAVMIHEVMQSGDYPNISALIAGVTHDQDSVVGGGCDDQVEFEFSLDLILNGLEEIRKTS